MTTKPSNDDEPEIQAEDGLEGYENPAPGGWEGYPLDELAIRDERRTASDVIRRIKNQRFVLDPDFQRGFVWDRNKQGSLGTRVAEKSPS